MTESRIVLQSTQASKVEVDSTQFTLAIQRTESTLTTASVGPQGAVGAQGVQGTQGVQGRSVQGVQGVSGIQGVQGPIGDATKVSYVHSQNTPSTTWAITHNLGYYPSVLVKDSAGTAVEGEIEYVSVSALNLHFSAGFSGTAYLS